MLKKEGAKDQEEGSTLQESQMACIILTQLPSFQNKIFF